MKTVPGRQYHIPHLVISPVWKMIHVYFSFLIFCFQCYLAISTLKYYVTVFSVTLPSSTDSSIPPHSWYIQVTILGEVSNEHCLLSDHVTVLRGESHSSWAFCISYEQRHWWLVFEMIISRMYLYSEQSWEIAVVFLSRAEDKLVYCLMWCLSLGQR